MCYMQSCTRMRNKKFKVKYYVHKRHKFHMMKVRIDFVLSKTKSDNDSITVYNLKQICFTQVRNLEVVVEFGFHRFATLESCKQEDPLK